jgi:hypothetical protein
MRVLKADLVLFAEGRPLLLVEAKSGLIPARLHATAIEQLRSLAERVRPAWTMLIDPETARIFRGVDVDHVYGSIPTSEIVALAGLGDVSTLGEYTLRLAVERWMQAVAAGSTSQSCGSLADFMADLKRIDDAIQEYAIAG